MDSWWTSMQNEKYRQQDWLDQSELDRLRRKGERREPDGVGPHYGMSEPAEASAPGDGIEGRSTGRRRLLDVGEKRLGRWLVGLVVGISMTAIAAMLLVG